MEKEDLGVLSLINVATFVAALVILSSFVLYDQVSAALADAAKKLSAKNKHMMEKYFFI